MSQNKNLFTFAITCLGMTVGSYNADAAMVSYWTFDSNFSDSGPFANTGGAGGSDGDASITSSSFVGSGALELDGNDALFLNAGSGAEYTTLDDNGQGFTVASWVRIDPNASGTSRIISTAMGGGFTPVGWGVGFDGTNMKATTYGKVDYNTGFSVTAGEWNHVAYRYGFNGTGQIDVVDFFINGALQGTVDGGVDGMNNAGGVYSIGNINLPNNEQYFHGRIDDLRVYDTELSNADIAALAAIPEPTSLVSGLALAGLIAARRRRKG